MWRLETYTAERVEGLYLGGKVLSLIHWGRSGKIPFFREVVFLLESKSFLVLKKINSMSLASQPFWPSISLSSNCSLMISRPPFFKSFFFLNVSIVDTQCCISCRCTASMIQEFYTLYYAHDECSSHLSPYKPITTVYIFPRLDPSSLWLTYSVSGSLWLPLSFSRPSLSSHALDLQDEIFWV